MTFAHPAPTARRAHLPRGWALAWLLALLLAQQVLLLHPLSHLPALQNLAGQPGGPAQVRVATSLPSTPAGLEPGGGIDRADAACLICLAAAGLAAAPPAADMALPRALAATSWLPTRAEPAVSAARRFRLARGPPARLQRA
ncbi:hypothetical protein [Sphaerotilus microaerophilus]|uniref:DUF2946 domain-containing protein n=1 Tax=Sphaerotilus microaerophilus TaxID=2914710 RepID=A0ABN6PF03_9BURK|nr:hypothetical protein [Sphaerotilus sp. FB-5]BDI03518.1 hypothetical protein CATMQ487_04880 [Sphaerotilus sp. FB-5]